MAVAALIVSVVAVVVSAVSVVYAKRSAVASQRSAGASEEGLAIEQARRLEERRPRLSGKIEGAGEKRILRITLESDEPLAGLDVVMSEWRLGAGPILGPQGGWDVEFNPRVYGVVVPPPGEPALRAYCYSPYGAEPSGLKPHSSITWAVNTKAHLEQVRLEVACHGSAGELWDIMMDLEAEPPVENTVA